MKAHKSERREYGWGVSFRLETMLDEQTDTRMVVSFVLIDGVYNLLPSGFINRRSYEPVGELGDVSA